MQHHTIDRAKYDHCVLMDESGLVYGFSWYLDTVAENWDALVLNDYDAVWPLPVRYKFGFKYFFRPFAIQQLGIFAKKPLSEEQINSFVQHMKSHCSYADIYLNESQLSDFNIDDDLKWSTNSNYTLPLHTSYREIYQAYKSNTKRNIKKAGNHTLSVFENDNPDVLINLFRQGRGDELKLSEQFYQVIKKAMYKCMHKGLGKVWTVYGERNEVCAGAFFIETEKKTILLFSALSDEGRDKQAMFYLINEYIILASGKSVIMDFEGSNLDSLARFYGGFGAECKAYKGLKYNGLPMPFRWLKK